MNQAGQRDQIQELDLLLDELEQLAASETSRVKFYTTVLERLKFVVGAEATAFAVPLDRTRWGIVATAGHGDFTTVLNPMAQSSDELAWTETGQLARDRFLMSLVTPKQPRRGALVIAFTSTVDMAARDEVFHLCQVFGELIAVRQGAEIEEFLGKKWPAFQQLLQDLSNSQSTDEAAALVVHGFLGVLEADRISWIQRSPILGDRVRAVSGCTSIEKRSDVIRAIEQIAREVIDSGKPQSSTLRPTPQLSSGLSKSPEGKGLSSDASTKQSADKVQLLAQNYVAFPLGMRDGNERKKCETALLIEWNEYEGLVRGMTLLNTVEPMLDVVWQEHDNWLRLPRPIRALSTVGLGRSIPRLLWPWLKFAFALLLLGGIAWAVTRPCDFRIEMQGVLEPVSQRTVYAALDGTVEQILVADNAEVKQGQLLVVMRSPSLEIEIQEALGELKANTEKRDSIALNINQLAREENASPSTLNRLSSEIRQLETQRDTLNLRIASLRKEEARLRLEAPIDGIVVARELDKLLDSRPLRRGDALFRIVNPSDEWQLRLSIADADVGYVRSKLYGASKETQSTDPLETNREFEFVIVSKPDLSFQGELVWLADSARNPSGDGVYVDAVGRIDSEALKHGYMGATVQAYLNCGQRPIWFVFSRTLVEAIQRKLWFTQ